MSIRAAFGVGLAAFILLPGPAFANEVMKDRCSRSVAFPPTYNGKPTDRGTVIINRTGSGWSPWSEPFRVALGDGGRIRWWCNNTTGNVFDPGTWRVTKVDGSRIAACVVSAVQAIVSDDAEALKKCKSPIEFGSSAFQGWTPERSRCGNRSGYIRARLGPDRQLQTECLGG